MGGVRPVGQTTMAKPVEVDKLISSLSDDIRSDFSKNKRIVSFAEYIDLFFEEPTRHARNAAQYIRDCFDYFSSYQVATPVGEVRRFKLFDGLEVGSPYLIGQEHAQNAVYRVLTNFIREGRINRLVILHGPNGSAKSSLVACIARALEVYSRTDEGALYRFNWIFPTEKLQTSSIGFGGKSADTSSLPSFAYLEDMEVNSRIRDEMRDPPLLLLPKEERAALFEKAGLNAARNDGSTDFTVSDLFLTGNLSNKNNAIFDALLTAYHGDFTEVVKHTQVERFYLSSRYRVGLATVGPQMRVDASLRQITADASLSALPACLQSVALYEPLGDLVDGNRGMVEFNDLLKRPMDLNRYLLSTSETGTVPVENCTLHLDTFLIGTVNETYLEALKGQPDWASYKGRIELVRMPYLRDYTTEQKIYEVQMAHIEIEKPIAPRVCELAALWAVLTRLRQPDPERYPEAVQEVIKGLSPLQKAKLYGIGELPQNLPGDVLRELEAVVGDIYLESSARPDYEGRFGASPREIQTILLNAAHQDQYPCFSPLALFEELEALVEDPSVYEFLRIEADGDYHAPAKFVELITEVYLDHVDNEVRIAMGLIEKAQYEQNFTRYVEQVSCWVRKEKILNPVSGKYEPADERFMAEVEERLGVDSDIQEYRNGIISSIGAFRVENASAPVDYTRIFSRQLDVLRSRFFDERKGAIRKIKMNLLRYFDDDIADLSRVDKEQVSQTMKNLEDEFGYTPETAKEAIGFLVRRRYQDNE